MPLPGSAIELYHSQVQRHKEKGQEGGFWEAERVWECATADAAAAEAFIWDDPFTLRNGETATPHSLLVSPHSRVGRARITASYTTEVSHGAAVWDPIVYPLDSATLSIDLHSQWSQRKSVFNGETELSLIGDPTVELGESPENVLFYRTASEEGTMSLLWTSMVLVNTAVRRVDLNWNDILEAMNKVNSYRLTKIGNAAAGTMLLVGAKLPKYFLIGEDTEIVPLTYVMLYKNTEWAPGKVGWPLTIDVSEYRHIVARLTIEAGWNPVTGEATDWYLEDGDTTDDITDSDIATRAVTRVLRTDFITEIAIRTQSTAEFQRLEGLLSWTT